MLISFSLLVKHQLFQAYLGTSKTILTWETLLLCPQPDFENYSNSTSQLYLLLGLWESGTLYQCVCSFREKLDFWTTLW